MSFTDATSSKSRGHKVVYVQHCTSLQIHQSLQCLCKWPFSNVCQNEYFLIHRQKFNRTNFARMFTETEGHTDSVTPGEIIPPRTILSANDDDALHSPHARNKNICIVPITKIN